MLFPVHSNLPDLLGASGLGRARAFARLLATCGFAAVVSAACAPAGDEAGAPSSEDALDPPRSTVAAAVATPGPIADTLFVVVHTRSPRALALGRPSIDRDFVAFHPGRCAPPVQLISAPGSSGLHYDVPVFAYAGMSSWVEEWSILVPPAACEAASHRYVAVEREPLAGLAAAAARELADDLGSTWRATPTAHLRWVTAEGADHLWSAIQLTDPEAGAGDPVHAIAGGLLNATGSVDLTFARLTGRTALWVPRHAVDLDSNGQLEILAIVHEARGDHEQVGVAVLRSGPGEWLADPVRPLFRIPSGAR